MIQNAEIIQINTVDGKLVAILSYQDENKEDANGYTHIDVPVNIRELQVSIRDNVLVDQSIKDDHAQSSNG